MRCECTFVCKVSGTGALGSVFSRIFGGGGGHSSGAVVLIKRPLEIPRYQEGMQITTEPDPLIVLNEGKAGHEVIAWFLPSAAADSTGRVRCTIRYEFTYYQRLVVPLNQYPVGFVDIFDDVPSDEVSHKCLTMVDGLEPKRFDFNDREFVKWYEKGGLHESPADESEIEFGFRVLEHMAKSLTIGRRNKGLSVRQVMASKTCTCHGCNSVFVASMRRKGIAARVKHGQKLKKENVKECTDPEFAGGWSGSRPPDKHNGHSKSEFYASGLGWIPVETVIRRPDQAKKRLANRCEEEPHLVKYYDMGDGTSIDLRRLGEAMGAGTKTTHPKLYVGQLSNVTVIPVSSHTLKPGTHRASDLQVRMHYDIV